MALQNQISPGERNQVEGKFGQAKAADSMDCIKAKLKTIPEFWIASIILVLNFVNLMRLTPPVLTSIINFIIINFVRNFGRRKFAPN
jgi:hypothetical protein